MPSPPSLKAKREAILGILLGIFMGVIAVMSGSEFVRKVPSVVSASDAAGAAGASMPATDAPLVTTDCVAPATLVASAGFDPYRILARERPDVLRFYAANGWDVGTRCTAIYDDWAAHGAGGAKPTTAAAVVIANGWVPATRAPTPTPLPSCAGPADETTKLGFDPYAILAVNRPDVLTLYAANGWKPATQCVAIFDDWLKHPDGGPATTAAAFVEQKGWAHAPTPTPAPAASRGAAAQRAVSAPAAVTVSEDRRS